MKFFKIFKSKPFSLRTFNSLSLPTIVLPITESELLNSIESSHWHFIKQAAPHYTPSLLSPTLTSLHHKPQLVLQLLSHLNGHSLDLTTSSLAACILCRLPSPKPSISLLQSLILSSTATNRTIFHELELSLDRLDAKTNLIFDLLVRTYCELKKPNEALECFYLMKEKGVKPNIETCNQMLSLFLRLNRTQMAWILHAEMFKMKIKCSMYTFNIMVNVLCKEGKLKKDAFRVRDEMMTTGFDPTILTYNALIQGLCKNREGEHAEELLKEMIKLPVYLAMGRVGLCPRPPKWAPQRVFVQEVLEREVRLSYWHKVNQLDFIEMYNNLFSRPPIRTMKNDCP
ncbi:pentatricopeptide repeat-containing protein At2g15630, mitochondrial-like [Vigna radiata var. radiata]|uniref:Pentatricopeptide repeat-containing protein At2g15630, mitochondrial-like n=1 Tax=Vigna radiata var. radiata TaxID=3916 RepID=A0A3Q0ENY5_VIGRR|nr:pentatricopeptide repeat-containing protein At2g15630, mitochondrial-like [Vigna radiata var. radiata]